MDVIDISRLQGSCENCSLSELCLPRGLGRDAVERLDAIVRRTRPLHKGDRLFRSGDSLDAIYAVRSGSMKLFTSGTGGEEQIIGFYLPGEILGLDGLDGKRHSCTAVALETSSVCGIPFAELSEICRQLPDLQEHLFDVMGREISTENRLLLTLNRRSAEARLATFLVTLSARFGRLGYSPREFKLSMSRQEIGNYLGLTIETVSRVFTRLQVLNLINVERRMVSILDRPGLQELSQGACAEEAASRGSAA